MTRKSESCRFSDSAPGVGIAAERKMLSFDTWYDAAYSAVVDCEPHKLVAGVLYTIVVMFALLVTRLFWRGARAVLSAAPVEVSDKCKLLCDAIEKSLYREVHMNPALQTSYVQHMLVNGGLVVELVGDAVQDLRVSNLCPLESMPEHERRCVYHAVQERVARHYNEKAQKETAIVIATLQQANDLTFLADLTIAAQNKGRAAAPLVAQPECLQNPVDEPKPSGAVVNNSVEPAAMVFMGAKKAIS